MAIGDVVNGIGADNTALNFQPAASVEVVLTSCGTSGRWIQLYNGANLSALMVSQPTSTADASNVNMKLFINNTNYIHLPAVGAGLFCSYTGIQIK